MTFELKRVSPQSELKLLSLWQISNEMTSLGLLEVLNTYLRTGKTGKMQPNIVWGLSF